MPTAKDGQSSLDSVESAIESIRAGGLVVVVDDEDRENEGDLICAADSVTTESAAFMIRHTSGVLCAALDPVDVDRRDQPQMVGRTEDPNNTAFTLSVDARHGVTTGISAADRARTIRLLAHGGAVPADFRRPGHVFPLRARPGGVLKRAGHTEAAVDLARLAGRRPAGVLAEIVRDDGGLMRLPQLRVFAREHGLPIISIADLIRHRVGTETLVERAATVPLLTRFGAFEAHAYTSLLDGVEHLAITRGEVTGEQPVLVRVHSECLTGDVFGSRRCDCGEQLAFSLRTIDAAGHGVVVYLRGQEGRGVGLAHKIRAYGLQDLGYDTVEANVELGLPVDDREYGIGARILADLGARRIRIMTNNPAKYEGIAGHGLSIVERVPVVIPPTDDNHRYLLTKQEKLGHLMGIGSEPTA